MTEEEGSSKAEPRDDARTLLAASALTIVRIKRRRDDPAEPEIILEAAGTHRNKQPRYDEVLLQFQGLSVMGAAAPSAPPATRQRFRRLRTMEVSIFEALSENEVLRLLRTQSLAAPNTSNDDAVKQMAADTAAGVVAYAGVSGCLGPTPGRYDLGLGQTSEPLHDTGQQRRVPVKAAHVPSRESRIAALRMSQKQAATAARYKQIRRRRETVAGEGAGTGLLHMYELERLPPTKPPGSTSGRGVNRNRPWKGALEDKLPPLGQVAQLTQQEQQPLRDSNTCSESSKSPAMLRQAQPPQPQPQQAASSVQVARTREEEDLLQRYAPLVDEVMKSLSVQNPQAVRRIPARPKRAMKAGPSTEAVAATAPVPQPAAASSSMETPVVEQAQAVAGDSIMTEATATGSSASEAGQTTSSLMDAATAEGMDGAERRMSDDGDSFVYDVYVPVHDDDAGSADEEMWPWLDAPSVVDLAVPVIAVAENDDEFFWAGQLDAEAADTEEHDSEDSNAESYYANSYPDEESSYANDGVSGGDDEELDEVDPADVGGGCSWGTALAMRRRQGSFSDEDEDGEDGDAEDEEIFGRRCHGQRVRHAKMLSCYRAAEDDYSEHSSYLSEEEGERREAEGRRHRAMFLR